MVFRFLKSRRAQVRGIDFSLSMVIFLLTMSQLLILTNNFIASSRIQQSSLDRASFADSLARDMLYSNGISTSTDWVNLPTSSISSSWEFGLSTKGEVDPFKIGRLANSSISSMYVDYTTVQQGLDIGDKKYQLTMRTPMDVNITSVINLGSWATIQVNGTVSINNSGLNNTQVQLFTIDSDTSQISEGSTFTTSSGFFTSTFTVVGGAGLSNTYLTVIAMAKYGSSSEGVAVHRVVIDAPAILGTNEISVFKTNTHSQGYSVNLATNRSHDGAIFNAFYVGSGLGSVNYTQSSAAISATIDGVPTWNNTDFQIPTSGLVVILTQETLGINVQNEAIVTFPALLDDKISNVVQPAKIPSSVSAIASLTFSVRGVLMILELVVWE